MLGGVKISGYDNQNLKCLETYFSMYSKKKNLIANFAEFYSYLSSTHGF